jgi:hypothetical protein
LSRRQLCSLALTLDPELDPADRMLSHRHAVHDAPRTNSMVPMAGGTADRGVGCFACRPPAGATALIRVCANSHGVIGAQRAVLLFDELQRIERAPEECVGGGAVRRSQCSLLAGGDQSSSRPWSCCGGRNPGTAPQSRPGIAYASTTRLERLRAEAFDRDEQRRRSDEHVDRQHL